MKMKNYLRISLLFIILLIIGIQNALAHRITESFVNGFENYLDQGFVRFKFYYYEKGFIFEHNLLFGNGLCKQTK